MDLTQFLCFKCEKTFASIQGLISHIKIMHALLQTFYCRQFYCPRHFGSIGQLRKHLIKEHGSSDFHLPQASPNQICDCNIKHSNAEKHTINETESSSHSQPNQPQINLEKEILKFVALLYSIPSFPRNLVQIVINNLTEFMTSISLQVNYTMDNLQLNHMSKESISSIFIDVKSTLSQLGSEYLRLNYFKKMKCYIPPKPVCFGEYPFAEKSESLGENALLSFKKAEGQIIPLREIFKLFLELPNIFNTVVEYMKYEESSPDVVTSFLSASLWQKTKLDLCKNKLFLPVIMYYDDFECCNPLGSKAGIYKIGAVYVSFACIPPKYASLLENIFVTELFYTSDRNLYGNNKTFEKLIEEFIFLENEGIQITIDGKTTRIYFKLMLIVGDNLGLNSILGFQESFNANYFCRICKTSKINTKNQSVEDPLTLRTKMHYTDDLSNLQYGIKEFCVFHKLQNFNISENMSCDLMHDMLEGICRYEAAYFFVYFIHKKKYFSLERLNERITFFQASAPSDLSAQYQKLNLNI